MSPAIAFDSLGCFENLKAAGVPEPQAKAHVEMVRSIVHTYDESSRKNLATKGDIQEVRGEIKDVRTELKEDIQKVRNEIQAVRTELKEDIQNVRTEISNASRENIRWVLGLTLAQAALIVSLFAFMK